MNKNILNSIISASILMSAVIITTTPVFALDAGTLPSLNSAVNGSTSINGNTMNVNVDAPQGGLSTFNWNTYNIGSDATVNYAFGHANQTALNLVNASGGMSQIYGKITQSTSCAGCDYSGTGKVILLNPNGVFFANGSSVNLNSFTVSSFDGQYDVAKKQLQLTKGDNAGKVIVNTGANIYADKNLAIAAPNIEIYNGSKLTTNIAPNVGTDSYGKIKLVTSDGLNFNYYNNGAVKSMTDIKTSADKMTLYIAGNLTSGNIDARNMSTNTGSQINLKGATLKATQAVTGNDGSIYLTANNKIVADSSTFTTNNYNNSVTGDGGIVRFYAGNKVSSLNNNISAVGDVIIESVNDNAVADTSTITSAKDVTFSAGKVASVQNSSKLTGANVNVSAGTNAQIYNAGLKATKDINVTGQSIAWTEKANLEAGNTINFTAPNGYILSNNSTFKAKDINLKSKDGIADSTVAGSTYTAGNNINVESTGDSIAFTTTSPFNATNLLNLKAAKNVEINATNDLTVKKTTFDAGDNVFLTSANGNTNIDSTTKFTKADNIYVTAKKDIKTTGEVNLNSIATTMIADNDINVNLNGVSNRNAGLSAQGGNNVTITTPGTLSVSSLISGNDMTINADKVIAGLPYTTQDYPDKATTNRSYIEVGGTFTSNTANDSFDITQSYNRTADGKYNQRHLIQYGNGAEKILLVNKRPVAPIDDPVLPIIDEGGEADPITPGEGTGTITPSDPVTPTPTPEDDNPDTPTPTPDDPTPDDPTPDPEECDEPGEGDTSVEETIPVLQMNSLLNNVYSTNTKKINE